MTPAQRRNFDRLLKPEHIAVFGGRDAEVVIKECERIDYTGEIWPVNPKRKQIGGYKCFASVDDLPSAPDAAFIAVPRNAALQTIQQLNTANTGGVVCYTAGFGEVAHDDGQGANAERALIEAAGDMALIGPNCYGVINYLDKVALWPFAHGGHSGNKSPGYGAAIITQSGMLSSDLTMNQRSVPLAYMISAGNQAVLGVEDFIEVLIENKAVRAIGLHIEGLRDVNRFIEATHAALKQHVPVVALKTGSSKIGARLTVSHTGSLSGSDDCYQALFDSLGIIRVHSPAQLLETLKFLCVAGVPKSNRLAGFTCSGGGATMLADYAEKIDLQFPPQSMKTSRHLKTLLPPIATVSNPLDYTTPIWGDSENLPPVFEAMFQDDYDAAVMVQDYPLPGLDESKPFYLNDAKSFVQATQQAGLPAAICSTLPENIDAQTRDFLIKENVAPMQGIHETLNAIAGASWYGQSSKDLLQTLSEKPQRVSGNVDESSWSFVNEWQGKQLLTKAGIATPKGYLVDSDQVVEAANKIGYPVVLKLVSDNLAHKTEAGAIVPDLRDAESVSQARDKIANSVAAFDTHIETTQFLVEKMLSKPAAELLVGIRNDNQFGLVLTLASGGVLTELVGDAVTLLLPATKFELDQALSKLKTAKLLEGFRGQAKVDKTMVIQDLLKLCEFAQNHMQDIGEIEINPLFVYEDYVSAVDALVKASLES